MLTGPPKQPSTGAETTADDRFRGLNTGRWCWRVGSERTLKSSAAKDWLEPKVTDVAFGTNVSTAQKADFAKSWVQIVIEVYFLRILGLSIADWGLEARTTGSVSRFKSISADRPETVDLPRVQRSEQIE